MKQENQKIYIIGGIALLAYFGVFRPILKKLGLATGSETNAVNQALTAPDDSNPFKPGYLNAVLRQHPGVPIKIKTEYGLQSLYNTFYSGFGYLFDDEDKINSVFLQMASKAQVSQFADYVQKKTGQDLLTFMKRGINSMNAASGLNDTEISKIIDIVNKKPIYTK
jgi:hypothetical protein